jgi:triosephosphate isomerase
MRRRLIVGNWKMHKTAAEAAEVVRRLLALAPPANGAEAVLAPPFTALDAVARTLAGSPRFALGAQDVHWEDQGPFTGEVSAPMLAAAGCRYVIVGHSERRQQFGERDDAINKKIRAALRHGLTPILCVGELSSDRDAGRTDAVVSAQLSGGLAGIAAHELSRVVLAYEPVWAIGTGRAATAEQAAAVHRTLRRTLEAGWDRGASDGIRILYGGSVTPNNIAELAAVPEIDGALVGGACLDPESFATILAFSSGSSTA